MAITYKTVIANAIADFNSIQNALAVKSTEVASTADSSAGSTLLATALIPDRIKEYLVYPSGSLTITKSGVTNVATAVTSGANRTGYASVTVPAVGALNLALTDQAGTNVTVGAESSGYYPITTALSGTVTPGSAGWINASAANVSDTNVVVGRIAKATFTIGNGTPTFTVAENTDSVSGYTNISGKASVSLSTPTSGKYFYALNMSATSSGAVKSNTAGYIPANVDLGSSSTSGSDTAYISIDSGSLSVSAGSDVSFTPTISKVDVSGSDGSSAALGDIFASTGNVTTTKPTTGYYLAVNTDSKESTFTASASTTEGYLAADSKTDTAKYTTNASGVTYIPLNAGSCTVAGGGLNSPSAFTPTVGISIGSQTTTGAALQDTAPTSGYYLKLDGSSSSGTRTVTRSAVTDTHTAGYIPAKASTTVIAEASKTVSIGAGSKTKYLTLPSASLANSATADVEYTENKSIVLTSGGYLYINHGYIADTKVSLSQLIPELDADAAASHIRSGYKAFTETGAVLTGTMADLDLSSTYFTSTNTGLGVVTGDRYNPSTKYIIKGSASLSTSAASSKITPTLSIVDVANTDGSTSTSGDIYASLGTELLDSKPGEGYYFAIKNSATSTTVTATPSVTPGWITEVTGDKTETVSVDEQTKYVSINSAEQSVAVDSLSAPTVNVTTSVVGGVKTSTSATSYGITLTNTETAGSVKAKYTTGEAGYVYKDKTATSAASSINPVVKFNNTEKASGGTSTIYLQEGSCTVSGGALSLNSNNNTSATPNDTGYAQIAPDSATSGYVKVVLTRAKVTDVHTEGYIGAGSTDAIAATTKTVKIPATSTSLISINEGDDSVDNASASISLGSATTFNDETGAIVSAGAKSGSGDISGKVTGSTGDLSHKYSTAASISISGGIQGTASASLNEDATGDTVDEYVESLYKRILGVSYTAVDAD